jgi:hypothetical protein
VSLVGPSAAESTFEAERPFSPGSGGVNRDLSLGFSSAAPAGCRCSIVGLPGVSVGVSVGGSAGGSAGVLGLPTLRSLKAHVVGSIRSADHQADSWSKF